MVLVNYLLPAKSNRTKKIIFFDNMFLTHKQTFFSIQLSKTYSKKASDDKFKLKLYLKGLSPKKIYNNLK